MDDLIVWSLRAVVWMLLLPVWVSWTMLWMAVALVTFGAAMHRPRRVVICRLPLKW